MWQDLGIYGAAMPYSSGHLFVTLCLTAGFAALLAMSSVAAVLLVGFGTLVLLVALAAAMVAVASGVWAVALAVAAPRSSGTAISG
jgi:hypothetical protein